MIKFTDLMNKDVAKGVAIGFGVAAAGLLLVPALRPVTRSAVKSGILLYEKGRELVAEAGEQLEDLVAEVRMELAEARLDGEELAEMMEGETAAETAESEG